MQRILSNYTIEQH